MKESNLQNEVIYYQGYRSPRALERERKEREELSKLESLKLQKKYEEDLRKNSDEELLKLNSQKKYGYKTLRPGSSSMVPEELERAQWYRSMEEEAFKKMKEMEVKAEQDLLKRMKEERKLKGKKSSLESAANEGKSEEEVAQEKEKEEKRLAEEEAERLEKEAADLLKPKFSNFVLDLGNEMAAKKAEEEKAEKNKRNGITKPPVENYLKAIDFSAKKWIIKLSDINPIK